MKKLILFSMLSILLMSCGHFRDGSSIWQGGLWLILVLPLIGAIFFFRAAWKSHKSGSTINPTLGGGEGGNVPLYQIPQFWFGVALVIAAIVFAIMQYSER